ncbi:MAG: xanthine dehydrogenase family protein subunit M [Xanthobacteraceae bacterium]
MDARFDLEMPDSCEDALQLLAADGAMPLAGGTNLVVDLRAKRVRPKLLVSLDRVKELRGVSAANGRIAIGARTTVTDLLRDPAIGAAAPSLVQSAKLFAGQMVRNTATVAGNLACGSPAADLVPPLLSLDAEVTLRSAGGQRTMPLADFFLDYHRNALRRGEIISALSWERLPPRGCNLFYKLARRKGDAITVTGVAVTVAVDGGKCTRARIALGAVAPIVFRARAAEAMLEGKALTPALIDAAAQAAAAASRPIDDIRASADYRRQMVRVLTRRLLSQTAEKLG